MLAASYPLLDVFWTMLIFFIWVAWFMLLFRIIADIFRRHDLGGGGKAVWILFVLVLPFLGVFVYLISQGSEMAQRDMERSQAAQEQYADYVKSVAGSGGSAAEIEKLKQLLDSGAITQTEYDAAKAKTLA
jgi:predicted PurR-regulated permease PerM